jgi:hypothetical protein
MDGNRYQDQLIFKISLRVYKNSGKKMEEFFVGNLKNNKITEGD